MGSCRDHVPASAPPASQRACQTLTAWARRRAGGRPRPGGHRRRTLQRRPVGAPGADRVLVVPHGVEGQLASRDPHPRSGTTPTRLPVKPTPKSLYIGSLPCHPILVGGFDHPFDYPDDPTDPSGHVWIDEASNVSRPDPSEAHQIDTEHQATTLVVSAGRVGRGVSGGGREAPGARPGLAPTAGSGCPRDRR